MYATPEDIARVWRPLSPAENANADLLLGAAARWINSNAPSPDPDAARFVSIEVVKAALLPGAQLGHENYGKTIGPWSKSGKLTNPDGALVFTAMHKQMLGISEGGPAWYFGDRMEGCR